MAKVLPKTYLENRRTAERSAPRALDWRKKISDHVAWALLVYTGLQIFVTVNAMKTEGASILPYLALVVLVGGIIPACRAFEKRWDHFNDKQAADPAYAPAFRRSVALLWVMAIALPLLLTGAFKLFTA